MSGKNKLLLIAVETGLWAACVLAMFWLYDRWLIPGPQGPIHWVGMDSVLFWVAARAMLLGHSPYAAGTVALIQTAVLGSPLQGEGDPMLFVYPAYIFLLIIPWALLPLKTAIAAWTGSLLFGMLHIIGYLAIRWGGRRPGPSSLWAAVLVIGSLPFVSIAVTKGQISLVCLAGVFLAIRTASSLPEQPGRRVAAPNDGGKKPAKVIRREILAGVFLVLSILKPTLTVPAMAGVLIWALIDRRCYVIAGFAACIGILFLASWLAVGNWIPNYLQLLNATGGAPILWSLSFIAWPWKILYALLYIGIGVLAFIRFLHTRNRTQWFSAAILAGMALFPMRWIYDLLLGILIPAESEQIKGSPAAALVIALLAPWGLALFPEPMRWPAQVIGLPLAWALVWLAFFFRPVGAERKLNP
jgi:hypothetical protein